MRFRYPLVLLAVLAAGGCDDDSMTGPDQGTTVVVEPIEIQSLEVIVGASRPAQVIARVRGALGSGCDFLHSIEQSREGRAVTVEVRRSKYTPGPCTAIFKEFQQELGLAGEFAAGQYTVRVNGVTQAFTVP
jgi:hypothetical protein